MTDALDPTAPQSAAKPQRTVFNGVYAGWATGSIGTGAVYNGVALLALFYFTTVLGLSAAVAGTILLAAKLYDAITDPLMGEISDRTSHRLGRRRPYLILGAVALGLSFAVLFSLPALPGAGLMAAIVVIALLFHATSYTIFTVPYLAMAPDIAPNYGERATLMSYRVAAMQVGVLATSVGAPLLVQVGGGQTAEGYRTMGLVIGAIAVAAGLVAFYATASHSKSEAEGEKLPPVENWGQFILEALLRLPRQFLSILNNGPFTLLMGVKLLQLVSFASTIACAPFFFIYVLGLDLTGMGPYLVTFSISGLLSIPVWRWAIGRIGKVGVFLIVCVWSAVMNLTWMVWTPEEAEWLFFARGILLGMASSGGLVATLSLLPDTMEYDRLTSKQAREGVLSGVFTTVEKFSGAIGPFLIGLLLEALGFIATRGGEVVEQPASAILAVKLGFAVVPALMSIAAIPLLLRYDLTSEKLSALRREVEAPS